MSRAVWLCIAGLASVAAPAAHAADANLVKALGPLIGESCQPIGDRLGEIKAGPLLDALLSNKVLSFDTPGPMIGQPGSILAPIILKAASGDNQKAYRRIGRIVTSWTAPGAAGAANFLPLAAGGVEVRARDGRTLGEADAVTVLADLIDRSDARYRFVCMPPEDSVPPPPDGGGGIARLVIAKEPTDLTVPELTDRPFAEFAYLRDDDAGTDTYSFYGTLGVSFGDRTIGKGGQGSTILRIRPLAFAQLEYEKASDTPAAKVDNLNFGAELGGYVQTRGNTTANQFWSLSLRYLTDTRFESSGWSGAVKWSPYFGVPGNMVPFAIGKRFEFQWRLSGVGDHAGFSDIGRKTELASAPHYTRLGLDAAAELHFKLAGSNIVTLGATYAWRENLERGPGDARRSSIRLTFAPSDNISLGLGYDRGRNIDTLEYTRTVKLTLGVRK